MQPFQPEAFDAASGVAEKSGGTSPLLDREYLFGGNAGVETAGSVPHSTDQRAHVEAADQWYALPPAPMPNITMEDPNGQWFAWDGSKALTITLPDRRDIRSLWFPTSLGIVEIFSGLTEGGVPLYTSNALAECAPIPSGNKTLTLVSLNGAFGSPMTIYATNDVLAPSRTAALPITNPTAGLQPVPVTLTLPTRQTFVSSTLSVPTGSGTYAYGFIDLPSGASDLELSTLVGEGPWKISFEPYSGTTSGSGSLQLGLAPPVIPPGSSSLGLYGVELTTASGFIGGVIWRKSFAGTNIAIGGTPSAIVGSYIGEFSRYLVTAQCNVSGSGSTDLQLIVGFTA